VKFRLNGGSPPTVAGGPWLITSRSVAQMAVAPTRTSTSATPGVGTGLSTRLNWPGSPKTQAFIVFMVFSRSIIHFPGPKGTILRLRRHCKPVYNLPPQKTAWFNQKEGSDEIGAIGPSDRRDAGVAAPRLRAGCNAERDIKDNTGGVLPGVTVTATNEASGNTFNSVTDERGTYRIPVRAGVYKITAELAGFTTVTRPGIELLLGRQIALDLDHAGVILQETGHRDR
jgi:hypothetical protein